jgi:4-amino-4-deoxy-L-arabinose transferase-like glycosyltransferase
MSAPALSPPDELLRPEENARTCLGPEARASSRRRRALVHVGLAVVLGVFVTRCVGQARSSAITSDESTYLTHALHFWMTGEDLDLWELGTPRLPHLAAGLASYGVLGRAGMLPTGADDAQAAIARLVLSGEPRVTLPARGVVIGMGVLLVLTVFGAVASRAGAWPGLVAAALVAMVPEVIAHASIAGSDLPFAAAAFVALALMARYAERPGPGRWLAVALAVGLSWAMRHSALVLIVLACGVHAVCALRRRRSPGVLTAVEALLGSVSACVVLTMVAFAVLWAGDGFETVTPSRLAAKVTSLSVPERIGPIVVADLPIPTSALSLWKQVRHQGRGHDAYFCGEVRSDGWPTYFPVAFLLKTPVGLLILMVLAAARVRPRNAWEVICLACLALLWMMLIRSRVNIGVRYALLTYPLATPLLARLFEGRALRDRVWGPVTLGAVAWFGGASIACGDRCLSSFNELGGGPRSGWLYLADSNVDWGQDFDALAGTLRRLGIAEVTVDVSTDRHLDGPGLVAIVNPFRAYQVPATTPMNRRLFDADGGYIPVYTRYVAVSVSRLMGLYSQNDMSWLRTRKVEARVGDSTFVFDMDTPAEIPFGP